MTLKKFAVYFVAFFMVIALTSISAFAETASWTKPTNYTDGSVIPATDTITVTLRDGGTAVCTGEVGTSCVVVVQCSPFGQPPVVHPFTATAHSSTYNTESADSAVFNYNAPSCPAKVPNAPVIIMITL